MNKKLARRATPEEWELSPKREELSNLQPLLGQRELDLITLRTVRLRKNSLQYGSLDAHVLIPLANVEHPLR